MSMYTLAHYPLDPAVVQACLVQKTLEPKRLLGKRTTGWHSEYRYSVEAAGPFKQVIQHIMSLYPDWLLDRWWINVCGLGELTHSHHHGHNMTSIVYYVQVPPNSGRIEFKDPNSWFTDDRAWVGYEPNAGDIVAFDGMLLHRVAENLSDEQRASIGINLVTPEEHKRTEWSRVQSK